jgi:hypothetical protein
MRCPRVADRNSTNGIRRTSDETLASRPPRGSLALAASGPPEGVGRRASGRRTRARHRRERWRNGAASNKRKNAGQESSAAVSQAGVMFGRFTACNTVFNFYGAGRSPACPRISRRPGAPLKKKGRPHWPRVADPPGGSVVRAVRASARAIQRTSGRVCPRRAAERGGPTPERRPRSSSQVQARQRAGARR